MYTLVWVSAVLIVLLAGPSSQQEDRYLEESQGYVRSPRFAQGGGRFTMKDYGFKIIDTGSQYGYESKIPGAQVYHVMGVSGGDEDSTDSATEMATEAATEAAAEAAA